MPVATTNTPKSTPKPVWAAVFVGLSTIIMTLDNTIVNVALSSIANYFNAPLSSAQWVINAYTLAFASLVGLEREYPTSMRVTPRLSQHGKSKMRVLKDACSPRLLQSLKGESVNTIFDGISLNPAQERSAFRVLRENSLYYDQRHPSRGTKPHVFRPPPATVLPLPPPPPRKPSKLRASAP